jgi:hypothetical protein
VLDAVGRYDAATQRDENRADAAMIAADAAERVRHGRDRFVAVMAEQEKIKKPYLLPQTLRDMSIVLLYFERLAEEFVMVGDQLAAGARQGRPPFVDLDVNGEDLDRFVSTNSDPVGRSLLGLRPSREIARS